MVPGGYLLLVEKAQMPGENHQSSVGTAPDTLVPLLRLLGHSHNKMFGICKDNNPFCVFSVQYVFHIPICCINPYLCKAFPN